MQQVRTVIVINVFDYITGGAGQIAISTANALAERGLHIIFFSALNCIGLVTGCGNSGSSGKGISAAFLQAANAITINAAMSALIAKCFGCTVNWFNYFIKVPDTSKVPDTCIPGPCCNREQ